MTVSNVHWERLEALPPEDVCGRACVCYDAVTRVYAVPMLERAVEVDLRRRRVLWRPDGRGEAVDAGIHAALVSVVYLLEAKALPPSGEWTTPEALLAGAFFFRGPHAVPVGRAELRFGRDWDGFVLAGCRRGGRPVEGGDATIELMPLPRVPMRLSLWLADDEFPARLTVLFDKTVERHLPPDALLALMQHVLGALVDAAPKTVSNPGNRTDRTA